MAIGTFTSFVKTLGAGARLKQMQRNWYIFVSIKILQIVVSLCEDILKK